jgi:hypothetical protein
MISDPEVLIGLSAGELEALSESRLAPSSQARLDELLALNARGQLSATDEAELNCLVERTDHLMLLKARARYTLQHQSAGATPT